MKRFGKLLGAAFVAASLTGCASLDLPQQENANQSLIVGYIDMSKAPAPLDWVEAKQLRPQTDKPYYYFDVDNGLFYGIFAPGVYKLISFGGSPILSNTRYEFDFPSQGKGALDFEIKTPGIYYLGAVKYVPEKVGFFQGLFGQGKFDIEKSDKPTEQEALSTVLKHAGSTKWKALILKRLDQIGGPVKVDK